MRLHLADAFTFLSVATALCAFSAVLSFKLGIAAVLLLASVLFDWIDGRVARAMGTARKEGMYLDSLADIVAFGAVPAGMALVLLPPTILSVGSAILFVCAGVYRLARFQSTSGKGGFLGVPITVNGVLVPIILVLRDGVLWWAFPLYFLVMAVLMTSTLRVPKL